MGVVYAARDERLQRAVALKTMTSARGDDTARRRFWREARAAARVNHPHVCQIYEIGEDDGELFIAMELLQGEVLAERLRRGALSVPEAVTVALEMLAALSALHAQGVIHRDLKPSNVFLTAHGVKLLDFGLARPETPEFDGEREDLTRAGVVMGTPRYMAPEQVTGGTADARSDLFAAGAILFEMLAGRPAFTGATMVEVFHATRYEQPPALTGSPAVAAVDRVIRRALAKRPDERPASADILADELRAVRGLESTSAPALAHPLTRLVVLPFRILRPDSETDFLAFSLPDAITTSLTGIGSLVLRSSAVAGRFGGNAPDLRALAAEADVDRVVMGTLLRAGAELRVSAQLVDAPSGTVLASHTVQSSLGDLFRLQDDIARRVADALALPLTGGTSLTPRDTPHDARAYELYLRGERARSHLRRAERGARALSAVRSIATRASPRRGPGSDAATASSASTSTARPTAKPAPRRPSAARSRSTRATRRRTSSTPTSKRTSARRLARWSGCSAKPLAMATIRSCSPGWSTPAATAASTSNPSPRITKPAGWIPTSRPASTRRCWCQATSIGCSPSSRRRSWRAPTTASG